MSRVLVRCCVLALALSGGGARALEMDARAKLFGVASALPDESLQRQISGTPALDYTADLRLMFNQDAGPFSFTAHYDALITGGDSYAFLTNPGVTLDQSATSDARRLMDLTWDLDRGERYRAVQRFDRLALQYRGATWGFILGREAVSWGSGIVFQPMDLISPFSPTTVDTEFKAGEDMLVVDKLFDDGSDLQAVGVARRNAAGNVTTDVASAAVKYRRFLGDKELEIFAAKHYADQVYGGSVRIPVQGAMLRADLVATRLDRGGWRFSGLLNLDYSFDLGGRSTWVFAEYYHNDFGVERLPASVLLLPEELTVRLARGEVFNVERDYLAAGGSLQWHPLWTQNLTLIGNLTDGSALLQTALSYVPGDNATIEGGLIWPFGDAGEEFGGIPLLSEDATTGGAFQVFLRWAYYF